LFIEITDPKLAKDRVRPYPDTFRNERHVEGGGTGKCKMDQERP